LITASGQPLQLTVKRGDTLSPNQLPPSRLFALSRSRKRERGERTIHPQTQTCHSPAPVGVSAGLESALSAISVHVPENVDTLHKIFVSEAKPRRRKKRFTLLVSNHLSKKNFLIFAESSPKFPRVF
jgi:hypothetical protein